ncbi:hypothetical protein CMK11_14160 [Candidatus Poribacteria bacterium]|nr:hypothetical protein [Candidatus Poribacteria bacterium]
MALSDGEVRLRPMTEGDWDILLPWNRDVGVLHFSDGPGVPPRSLEETQGIYRGVSQDAYCFIIEWAGRPVGECWLQRLNLDWLRRLHPSDDCRRIDITIGEKDCWGKGVGSRAVRLLVEFAFESERADVVFACDVADYNPRSRRMFESLGFELSKERGADPIRAYLTLRRPARATAGYGHT